MTPVLSNPSSLTPVLTDPRPPDSSRDPQGGYSTRREMCMAFVTYFPRSPLSGCSSQPHVGDFLMHAMGVQSVDVAGLRLP